MKRKRRRLVRTLCMLAVVSALVISAAGCGSEEIKSLAKDRDIVIDGDYEDWEGALQFNEDANLSYGLINDDRSLYLVVAVGDRAVRRQIMVAGFYLWFDPAGKENKSFGLRYPIGLQEGSADLSPLLHEQDPNKMQAAFRDAVKEFMIIGAGDQVWRRGSTRSIYGVEAAAVADKNVLVLEFRVPVGDTGEYGYGIGSTAGSVIGFGVQTPEIDVDAMKEQMREAVGGRGGGGKGGMGGGGRGGRGGGGMRDGTRPPGGQRPEIPDPIKVWTKVQLAAGESQS
jgi:hypothetical protein